MILVNQPQLEGNEKKYLVECIESGWISSEGRFVGDFEREFAAKVGRRHAIAVNSGTAALEAAVVSLRLEAGAEVIMPAFTIVCCASAILRAGATPVLVDCDPLTWNMDVEQVAAKITPRTKAIMAVHIYGLPVDMDPIRELAKRHNLAVIEDAAEAIGLRYRGQWCGAMGDISALSFYANKHVTTGEGGMILTDDDELASRCRSLRNLCFLPEKRFVHEELGWNLRMCNLQAAVGLAQLEKLDDAIAFKRWMGGAYQDLLADLQPKIQLPVDQTDYADNVYWVFGIVLDDTIPFDAVECAQRLAQRGIQTRPFFWPMHEQPVFQKAGLFRNESYPISERIARRGLYLPSGISLSESDLQSSCSALREVLET